MLIFFLTEKEENSYLFLLREKKERNKNNQEGVLDYSLHKRGFEAILVPICCLSKRQRIDKKIVVWSSSWQLWRQSVDFALQEVFLESLPIEIIFELISYFVLKQFIKHMLKQVKSKDTT